MRTLIARLIMALMLATGPAAAHGPTPQKVDEMIAIAAPPQAVWAAVKDFDGLAGWDPSVASSAGRGGNAAGGERDVVLKSGGQLTDSLDEYLDSEMSYSYRLAKPDIEDFPVSFYSATLAVRSGADGGSEVVWNSRFYRADTGNFPSEAQNDQAAVAAMTNLFRDGLQNLKKKLETP